NATLAVRNAGLRLAKTILAVANAALRVANAGLRTAKMILATANAVLRRRNGADCRYNASSDSP
ncbi:MAG TPA: hypothetical protein VMM92_05495, partial [Thermoanaerobaculia bacterium]|nr:hypothetical protein [Thermoanaerobaculia bacterium]